MSIAYVQQAVNSFLNTTTPVNSLSTNGGGQEPTPFPSNVTAGNLLVYKVGYIQSQIGSYGAPTFALSDNLGNSYTKIAGITVLNGYFEIGYAQNITGGACNVNCQVTVPSGSYADQYQYWGLQVSEWSGLSTSAPFTTGQNAMSYTSNTSNSNFWASQYSTATPTLDTSAGLAIGYACDEGQVRGKTPGTGWTATSANTTFWYYGGTSGPGGGIEIYQILNSTTGANANVLFAQYQPVTGPCMVVVFDPPSGVIPTTFKMYANGAVQAHVFQPYASLPSGVICRIGANNTIQATSFANNGIGQIKMCANGQFQCNNQIIV